MTFVRSRRPRYLPWRGFGCQSAQVAGQEHPRGLPGYGQQQLRADLAVLQGLVVRDTGWWRSQGRRTGAFQVSVPGRMHKRPSREPVDLSPGPRARA